MTAREHLRWWLVGLLVAGGLVWLLRDVLLPFVAGAAVAYFLDPLADRLERRGLSRTLATTLITLLFVLVLIAALLLIIPTAYNQLMGFAERLPRYTAKLHELIAPYVADALTHVPEIEFDKIKDALGIAGSMAAVVAGIAGKVVAGGLAVINLLSLVFITPIVAFYLLRDWDTIVTRIDGWLPRRQASTIRQLAREIDTVLAAFIRGQIGVCLVMGTFYAVALSLIGLDFGLLVGAAAGFVTFIPYLGAGIGLGLSLVMGAVQFLPNFWPLLAILAVFLVGQTIESNVLTPKLVGDKVGLHAVWVIFAMLAGGSLFGFVGVLIALPVAAAVGVLVRFSLARYVTSKLYHGPDG